MHFPPDFADMASKALKLFLFGTVISLLNPWMLLPALSSIVNFFMAGWERNQNYKTQDKLYQYPVFDS